METQEILERITALRVRLESAADPNGVPPGTGTLAKQISAGGEHDSHVEAAVRPFAAKPAEKGSMPRQLTARARRVLELGRALLARLRDLADAFAPSDDRTPLVPDDDVLAHFYRETTTMADTALRIVPLLPGTAAAQLRLCEGLEAILADIDSRVRTLSFATMERQEEEDRIGRLAGLLVDLNAGRVKTLGPFHSLVEQELHDLREGKALVFLSGVHGNPAIAAARHGLNTARVLARIARHDPDLRARLFDLALAGMLHDAGMVQVPGEILTQPKALHDDQKRLVERHCHAGATLIAQLAPDAPWLAEAARTHHERLDGTGYPDGLREGQITPLNRLIAVADVYAACCAPRHYRPALETRTALTDTLLLADQGHLDRVHGERLLHLSFYPAGQAVELGDGSFGVVVGQGSGRDLNSPARPAVALLVDGQGEPLARPRYIDLGICDGHSIVRTLTEIERQQVLGKHFPGW